jgi:excinuclease UvrABC nuclease subunit
LSGAIASESLVNDMTDVLKAEARRFLELLGTAPFTRCYPLTREFEGMPTTPGFYAFRHRSAGILYIGIATNLRRRFRNGHKALAWAFIDRLDPDDVRIAAVGIDRQTAPQVEYLETLMIQSARPRYNSRIK